MDETKTASSARMESSVPTGNYVSLLMIACQQGHLHQVQELLARERPNSSVDPVLIVDRNGRSALHYCAEYSRMDCVTFILETIEEPRKKALLDIADNEGFTPLFIATINGNSAMLKLLISNGAEVSFQDKELHTPVHWAVVCGHYDCLELLLQHKAQAPSDDIHGAYPLHYAAQITAQPSDTSHKHSSAHVTVSPPVAPTVPVSDQPATSSTTRNNSLRFLERLLEYGVDVSPLDADRRQPLLWAASSGASEACLLLVKAGADVTVGDKDGLTALHCAASRGHAECVRVLVEDCGTDVDVKDKHDCTPLMYSATLGFLDCIRYLGGHGASKDYQDRKGRSAAHLAASKGQTESIMEIEEMGGNIWLTNYRGDLPLHEAAQAGYIGVVEYLLSKSPDHINAVNHNGRSCLHLAAMQKDFALCQFLVESKINVNLVMQNSKMQYFTALDLAIAKNNVEMIKYLRSHQAIESSQLTNKAASLIQQSFLKRFSGASRLSSTSSDPNGILEEAFETGLRSSPCFQSPVNFTRKSSLAASKDAGETFDNVEPGETDGSMYPHLPREVTSSPTDFDHLVTMERHSDYDAIMEASVLGRRNSGIPQLSTPIFEIPLANAEEPILSARDAQVPPLKSQNSSTSIAHHEVSGNSRSGATIGAESTSRKRSVPKLEVVIVDSNYSENDNRNSMKSARSEGPLTPVFQMTALALEPDVPSRSVSRSSLVKYESDSGSDEDMKHPDHRSNFMRKMLSQQNSFLTPKTPEHNRRLTMSRSLNSLKPDDTDLPGADTSWMSARYQKSVSAEEALHGMDASDFIAGFQHPALLSLLPQDNVIDEPVPLNTETQTGPDAQSARDVSPPSRKHSISSMSLARPQLHETVAASVQTSARTPRQFKISQTNDAGVSARRSTTSDSEVQTSARETYGSSWASDSSSLMSSTPRSRHLSVSTDDAHSFPLSSKGASDTEETPPPSQNKPTPIPKGRKSLETGGELLQRRASRLRWDDSNLDELHALGSKPYTLDITSDHVSFREPETITDVVGGQVRTSPVIREASDEDSDVAPEEYSTTQSLYSRFRPPTPRVLSLRDVRHTLEVPTRSRTTGSKGPVLQTSLRHRDRSRPDRTRSVEPSTIKSSNAKRTRRMLDEMEQPVNRTLPQMPMKFVSSFNNTVFDIAPHSVILKYLDQLEQMQKKDTKYNQSVVLAKVIPKYLKDMEGIGKPDKMAQQQDVTGKTKSFKDWQQYLLRKLNNLSPMNASPLTDITESRSTTTMRSRTESEGSSDTLPRMKSDTSSVDAMNVSSVRQSTNGPATRSEKSSVGSGSHHPSQGSSQNGLSGIISGDTSAKFPILSPIIHPFPWR